MKEINARHFKCETLKEKTFSESCIEMKVFITSKKEKDSERKRYQNQRMK